jgi:hypothetical protein
VADSNFLTPGSLDFFDIKENLKNHLKNQAIFKDLDFEGSNINVLLDVLSYNTYLNSFYLNMIGNEMFLDTSLMRDSVVSHAKELNYLPRSRRSAKAVLDLTITVPTTSTNTVVIPAYSEFTTKINNSTYVFSNEESVAVKRSINDTFIASGLEIYEGVVLTEKITVLPVGQNKQRFVLTNKNIDASSIRVVVYQTSQSTVGVTYEQATSLLGLTPDSTVFFTQAFSGDKYEVLFGDNVFGKDISTGNVISITYRVTKGVEGNGVNVFSSPSFSGFSSIVSVTAAASGGAEMEDIEVIRRNAPKYFTSQDRAVTADDYRALIIKEYPMIKNISIYGGETVAESPQYGRVYVSAVTEDGGVLSASDRASIRNYLRKKTFLSLETLFRDPDFTYVMVNSTVKLSKALQKYSILDMRTKTVQAIKDYNTLNLKDFGVKFRYSKLLSIIDAVDESVVGSEVTISMMKQFTPILNTADSATLNFNNPIVSGSLTSTVFSYVFQSVVRDTYIVDDSGTLKMVSPTTTGIETINQNIGTIDYLTGKVAITNFNISAYPTTTIRVTAKSPNQDLSSLNNQVLEINEEYGLSVIVIQETN